MKSHTFMRTKKISFSFLRPKFLARINGSEVMPKPIIERCVFEARLFCRQKWARHPPPDHELLATPLVKAEKIMEKFERYCNPRKNLTLERHSFFSRNQQEGETIDAYVTELRNKAHRCEFSDLKDGLIRDRIVCGIMNDSVRARLLKESDLSLEKCVDICRAAGISTSRLRELNDEKAIHRVHVEEKAGQSDMAKSRREERIPIITCVTSVVIDIEEAGAQPMVKLAINARNYIILPMFVKQERLMLLIILQRNLTNISLLVS